MVELEEVFRFVELYLRIESGYFFKLVEVEESGLEGDGIGCFDCCNFSIGRIVTIYLGSVVNPSIDSIYLITNGSVILYCKPWLKGGSWE